MTTEVEFIHPDWPAPPRVRAAVTTRNGGVSLPPYASLNLGAHCGDHPGHVHANRHRVYQTLALPATPAWLDQCHGNRLVSVNQVLAGDKQADAVYSSRPRQVCAVLTADCLPVLLCDREGRRVCAVHAGWRGLAAGVLENAVAGFRCAPGEVLAWLGPAIGPQAFQVGAEVRAAFIATAPQAARAFRADGPGHYRCDLYQLARQRLRGGGVRRVYGGEFCTYSEPERFYSYRRDRDTGRMASLIWLE